METPHNRRFDARNELFLDVRNFIERFCADAGVGHRAGERLTLIIEELFANTVRHGYPGADGNEEDSKAPCVSGGAAANAATTCSSTALMRS